MQNVTEIEAARFEAEVTESAIPVVVDFYATWCPPCKALAPILDRVAGGFAGQVKFVKLNTDEAPELAAQFGVRGVPTLVFIKGGKAVNTLVGLRPEADIKAAASALLAQP